MSENEITNFFKDADYLRETTCDDTLSIEPDKGYALYQIVGTRANQQDCIEVSKKNDSILAVVCDGMGGLKGGERASADAVSQFVLDYQKNEWDDTTGFLFNEVIQLDKLVSELKDENGDNLSAGTTLVAVIIKDRKLHYISVGDSRIYLMRGKEMVMLTEDQNYGMTLKRSLQQGIISEEEYKKEEKYADALISYIGMGGLKVIGCSNEHALELKSGDKILLCSDGLYKSLSQSEIEEELVKCDSDNLDETLQNLVNKALNKAVNNGKKQDNTSAILLVES